MHTHTCKTYSACSSDREDILDKVRSSRKGKAVVREQEPPLINDDSILSASEDGLSPIANDSPSQVEDNSGYVDILVSVIVAVWMLTHAQV